MEYRYKPTTNGLAAMAAYMALEKPFHITRVAFGSGKVDEGINLADVHELLSYVSDGAVADRNHKDARFNLTIQYANSEHKEIKTFLLTEFIVYVEDPVSGENTDLLYGTLGDYRQPAPSYNPAYPPSVFNFPLQLVLSDEINVVISAPAGLPTYDDLETVVRRHNEDLEAHAELLKQFVKAGKPGEPGSAVLLDETGKIPVPYLPDEVFNQGGAWVGVITILASAWEPDTDPDALGPYQAVISCEESTSAHIPYVSVDKPSATTAANCGMCDMSDAVDGAVHFWAKTIPTADIIARVALFGPGGTAGGGRYVPKVGAGLNVGEDGTLSLDFASGAEVDEMLNGVFSPDNK